MCKYKKIVIIHDVSSAIMGYGYEYQEDENQEDEE